jgi:hypothetical protein
MPRVGMLVQLDGSQHDWLEDLGPCLVLITVIDDASGEVLAATFRDVCDREGANAFLQRFLPRFNAAALPRLRSGARAARGTLH